MHSPIKAWPPPPSEGVEAASVSHAVIVRGRTGVRRRSRVYGSHSRSSGTWMPHDPGGTVWPRSGLKLAVPISSGIRSVLPGATRNMISGMIWAPARPGGQIFHGKKGELYQRYHELLRHAGDRT